MYRVSLLKAWFAAVQMHIIALIVVYADIRLDSYDVDCIIELSGPKNQTTFQSF